MGAFEMCVENRFRRGDINADGLFDIGDPLALLGYAFRGAPSALPCLKAADVTDSGRIIAVTGAVVLLSNLFLDGPPPPEPFTSCGHDPTPDALSCASHPPCRP